MIVICLIRRNMLYLLHPRTRPSIAHAACVVNIEVMFATASYVTLQRCAIPTALPEEPGGGGLIAIAGIWNNI
jgi:hypothetical protein